VPEYFEKIADFSMLMPIELSDRGRHDRAQVRSYRQITSAAVDAPIVNAGLAAGIGRQMRLDL
jgi:hypothetical protein